MTKKTFVQVVDEIRGKKILVANRGIPARRIVRSIREFPEAIPVMTATDIDKTAPVTSGAQELILLGDNPRAVYAGSMGTNRERHGYRPGRGTVSAFSKRLGHATQWGCLVLGASGNQ